MAKKPWILLGFLLLGAVGAETGRRLIFSKGLEPLATEEEKAEPDPQPPPVSSSPQLNIPQAILNKESEIRALFAEKRYAEALELIKKELGQIARSEEQNGYRSWLERQRWIVMTAQAWVFLEKQNCTAAMTLLEEIPELERPDVALKGMGYCKFLSREWQEADSLLTRFLQTQKSDHEALEMLSRTKESQGLYEEALELTEILKDVDPEEKVALDIEPLRKSLLAKQDESLNQLTREGSYFTLHYQPSLSPDFLDRVAETVQKTGLKLNLEFGIDYPAKSIDIFLHSAERFGEITHGPEWSTGIYDGQIRLPVPASGIFDEQVARAIRHEMTHALLSEMVQRRNLPTWFQEGFAQLSECEQFCMQYDYAATTQKFMPIEMFEKPFLSLSTREAQVAYKQSLYMTILLVHYRKEADIKQMFSLLPSLDPLSSNEIIAQAGWSFPFLHQSATKAWDMQISLRDLTSPN